MSKETPQNPQNPHNSEPPTQPTEAPVGPADISGLKADPYAELRALSRDRSAGKPDEYEPTAFDALIDENLELPPAAAVHPRGWRGMSSKRRHNILRHGIPTLTALAVGAGALTAVATRGEGGPTHSATATHAAEGPGKAVAEGTSVTTGHKWLDAKYRKALANDNCETKVSFADMVHVHNELAQVLGQKDIEASSVQRFQQETNSLTSAIKETRSQLDFAPLPKNIRDLVEHEMDAKVPLSVYEQSLQNYMAQFGVEAQFEWQEDQGEDAGAIAPVPEDKLEKSAEVRAVVVDTILRFNQLPMSLVRQVGLKKIQLGRILNADSVTSGQILGQVINNRTIMLDVWSLGSPAKQQALGGNLDLLQQVPAHEFEHTWQYATCFRMLGEFTKDQAFADLMNGFHYGKKAVNKLSKTNHDGHFIPLGTAPKDHNQDQVAVADPYGATNTTEAEATLFGQDVFDSNDVSQLVYTNANENKLFDQVILLLARVGKKDPTLREYYIDQIKAGRLSLALSNNISEINLRNQEPVQSSSRPNFSHPAAPYSKLLLQLTNVMIGQETVLDGLGP